MANLSTERISFEQALANLLDLYGIEGGVGGGGTGTILPTRLTLINLVKAKLDELIPEGEGVVYDLEDTPNVSDPYDLLINAILNEAAKRVLMNCPKHYLDPVKSNETAIPDLSDTKIGYIKIPNNFLRFISLKMAEWKTDVTEITPSDSVEYRMQFNQYVRGGIAKPKVISRYRTLTTPSITEEIQTTVVGAIKYGNLYDYHALTQLSSICAVNAHVPTITEWGDLVIAAGGKDVAGGKLKETGTTYWLTPNTGALDTYGFGARPGGVRLSTTDSDGYLTKSAYYWSATEENTLNAKFISLSYSNDDVFGAFPQLSMGGGFMPKLTGMSVRLIVDTPIEIDGTDAIYVGNDGTRYNCKLMPDGKWWTVENLIETKYRNGNDITITLDFDSWIALGTQGGIAYYGNDFNNQSDVTTATSTIEIVPATSYTSRVLEYFSVNYSHSIDWLYYIQETEAENVQENIWDALTWAAAGMVLQIIERVDLSTIAFQRELESYVKATA